MTHHSGNPQNPIRTLLKELFSSAHNVNYHIYPQYPQYDAELVLDTYSPIECGIFEFEALATLFGVRPYDITRDDWVQTTAGCDTCGHGSDGYVSFSIRNLKMDDAAITNNVALVREMIGVDRERRAAEAREAHEAYEKAQAGKRAKRIEAQLMDNEDYARWHNAKRNIINVIDTLWATIRTSDKKL
jgi:hypothetical protein